MKLSTLQSLLSSNSKKIRYLEEDVRVMKDHAKFRVECKDYVEANITYDYIKQLKAKIKKAVDVQKELKLELNKAARDIRLTMRIEPRWRKFAELLKSERA